MIHPIVKIITVDGFFTEEDAIRLTTITYNLNYIDTDFGKEIPNFNMTGENTSDLFSKILNTDIIVDDDKSGIFRKPNNLIHFESFENLNEWVFVVALQNSTLNVFEHKSGAVNALDDYKFNYRDLFQWNLQINYLLKPGQGVLFRPWLFHSFDTGLVQIFRLKEYDNVLYI
jgi:hypothetical protein